MFFVTGGGALIGWLAAKAASQPIRFYRIESQSKSKQKHLSRDGRIPLFFDIRIFGYLGYQFFLDTWIIGYLDIMDTWIHGYMDTWISVFFGYMDTWILWISIFFIIHILDILSKYPDIFGYFFKLPNMKKRQSIQVLRLCSMFILSIDKIRSMNK